GTVPLTKDITISGGSAWSEARSGAGARPGANSASRVSAAHSRAGSPRDQERYRLTTRPRPASTVTSCVAWCGGTRAIIAGTGPCGQDRAGEPRGGGSGGDDLAREEPIPGG